MLTIYTAIFGKRDRLKPPLFLHPDIHYVCYTNNPKNQEKGVETIIVDPKLRCLSRSSKWYKMHPPEGDSLWIDGAFQVLSDPRPVLDTIPGDVALRPHSTKNCLYLEAIQCAARQSDLPRVILRQAMQYYKDGMPQGFGMWEGGVIFRRKDCARNWQERWWFELLAGSCRDQISLPYVVWKLGVQITPLPWLVDAGVLKHHEHSDKLNKIKRMRPIMEWKPPEAI